MGAFTQREDRSMRRTVSQALLSPCVVCSDLIPLLNMALRQDAVKNLITTTVVVVYFALVCSIPPKVANDQTFSAIVGYAAVRDARTAREHTVLHGILNLALIGSTSQQALKRQRYYLTTPVEGYLRELHSSSNGTGRPF
jgi:hypothetical protein